MLRSLIRRNSSIDDVNRSLKINRYKPHRQSFSHWRMSVHFAVMTLSTQLASFTPLDIVFIFFSFCLYEVGVFERDLESSLVFEKKKVFHLMSLRLVVGQDIRIVSATPEAFRVRLWKDVIERVGTTRDELALVWSSMCSTIPNCAFRIYDWERTLLDEFC